jgi:hypothetical protein
MIEMNELPSMIGTAGINRPPVILSYGCGVDSTAMLAELVRMGTPPDAITFADTGGEKPDTYRFLLLMDAWLASRGVPLMPNVWHRPPGYEDTGLPETWPMRCIVVVRNDGMYGTLEKNCLVRKMLPSLAYGRKGCSEKYKTRPQHKWAKRWEPARLWWEMTGRRRRKGHGGRRVVRIIGLSASEMHRASIEQDDFYDYVYPLRVWEWRRQECVEALPKGLPAPPKSACFFCPASTKTEILQLGVDSPGLLKRALEMEKNAEPNFVSVGGLGRRLNWGRFLAGEAAQQQESGPAGISCVCTRTGVFDGDAIDSDDDGADADDLSEE